MQKLNRIVKPAVLVLTIITIVYGGLYHMVILQTYALTEQLTCPEGSEAGCNDRFESGWNVLAHFPFVLLAWAFVTLLLVFSAVPDGKKKQEVPT